LLLRVLKTLIPFLVFTNNFSYESIKAVECNTREGWVPGTIAAFWFRKESMPPGKVAPYQIRLDHDGGLIWAPADDERVIRARVGGHA
jgi:hypothetical protein